MPQPSALFSKVEAESENAALLESCSTLQRPARYSIVAWGAKDKVAGKNGKAQGSFLDEFRDPVEVLEEMVLRSQEIPLSTMYRGGPIGYVAYDSVRYWETIRNENPEAEQWPDFEFFIPENVVVYDNYQEKAYVYGDYGEGGRNSVEPFTVRMTLESMNESEFENAVRKAKEYIESGYAFQIVLSRFYSYEFHGDPLALYLNLKAINPSPYMFYLKFGQRKLVGSSPEMLFTVQDGSLEIDPIAGSRPRGKDPEEDLQLEMELVNSEKERAEHLMLVDLARNDAGKVALSGSLKVIDLMHVEKYSHVQHMVSRVIGTLKKNAVSLDLLRATFPAGTVSGAPKPSAMNIIEELEPFRRGPYAGAVGFISPNGNSEFALTIRSALLNEDTMRIQAGAGIVYDSNPQGEYRETEIKMRAVRLAAGDGEVQ
ncbi:anthranilate synthase component I [Tardisphaera miroshnichenkoae]